MRGRSFADVLDDALHLGAEPVPVPAVSWRFTAPPPGPVPVLGIAGPTPLARAAYALAAAGAPLPRPRPAHPLTAPQQDAFAALNALGARLTPAFTAAELRTAYRQLAHHLHPDRRHGCGEAERLQRSRDFAAATDHYKVLLGLFPRH